MRKFVLIKKQLIRECNIMTLLSFKNIVFPSWRRVLPYDKVDNGHKIDIAICVLVSFSLYFVSISMYMFSFMSLYIYISIPFIVLVFSGCTSSLYVHFPLSMCPFLFNIYSYFTFIISLIRIGCSL